jgi:hypothetical protein
VSETMVLLPWWPFSPEVFGSLPFYKAMLAILGKRFDVSVARHQWIVGDRMTTAPPRTVDDLAGAFAQYVTADGHLVATGGTGVFALIATSRHQPQLKSFVFDSFPAPPATLGAMGMSGLADLAAVALRVEPAGLRDLIPMAMPASDQAEVAGLIARVRPTIDWDHCSAVFQLAQEVNLLELEIVLPKATLFLANPVAFPGLLDRRMARTLFPDIEVQTREASDIMDPEKGAHFAEQILDHIGRRAK